MSDAAGDETVGELAFAVTLDAAAAVEVALGYATADGTALAGSDYEAASGTLTFAPGETAKTIRVVVLDDGLDEATRRPSRRCRNLRGRSSERTPRRA